MKTGTLIPAFHKLSSTISLCKSVLNNFPIDSVWVSDRLVLVASHFDGKTVNQFLDPFITLSTLASTSPSHIEFGIAVTDLVRRSAPDLARASFTLSQALNGPLNMGLGSGEAINLSPLGYELPKAPVAHFESQLKQYKQIRTSGIYNGAGGGKVELGYNSCPSRIWIGGQRDRMLRITAEHADGWLPAWKMSPLEYTEKANKISCLAKKSSKNKPEMGMLAPVVLGESKQKIFQQIERFPAMKLGALDAPAELWRKWGMTHPGGAHTKGLPDLDIDKLSREAVFQSLSSIPAEFFADMAFVGSVDDILLELWEYRQAGLEHLVLILQADFISGQLTDFYSDKFKRIYSELKRW